MSGAEVRPGYSPARAIAVAAVGLAVPVLPMFMVGALGVQIMSELGFGAVGLGAAVLVQRMATIPSVYFGGRLTDRLGASRALRLAGILTAIGCLGIALSARSWPTLVVWLVLSGGGLALSDPAANRLLVRAVPSERLGNAFGFKQSAPPTATMIAGMSVPLVALTIGWRWAFALAALPCLALILAVGRLPPQRVASADSARSRLRSRSLVAAMALALGLGTASSSTVSTFYVTSAVDAGTAVDTAGFILALASIVTILTRIGTGLIADRFAGRLMRLYVSGQILGTIGLLLLASNAPGLMGIGAVVGLAGTWGLHGVFWFAVVRSHPDAPGAITGSVAPGALAGGALGPLLFGYVAALGNPTAWMVTAGFSVLSVVVAMFLARRLAFRPAAPQPPSPGQAT